MAKRSRSGAAPGAPKPKIEPPKTPVTRTRSFRWSLLLLLALGTTLLVASVMGASHRRGTIDAYDRDLGRAMRSFSQHQAETVPDSFLNIPTRFSDGSITPKRLREAAGTWQEDFTEAAGKVRALTPPEELRNAQEMIAQAMDAHATIAGHYLTLAEQRQAADRATGALETRLEGVVTSWIARINAARANASSLLAAGRAAVDELKREWGLTPAPATPEIPDINLSDVPIPDGGLPN